MNAVQVVDTDTGEILNPLSAAESSLLIKAEATIQAGLDTFVEVGEALAEIRDSRLYRDKHSTFEAYCRERWGMQRAQAYRLIESAEVVAALSPIGDTPPITNEAQARALAPIIREHGAEKAAEVLRHVAEESTKVTAKTITETAQRIGVAPRPMPIPPEPAEPQDQNAAWRLKLRNRVGEAVGAMGTATHPNNIADTLLGIAENAHVSNWSFTATDLRELANQANDLADLVEQK